jgi:hypothetical protein
MTEIEPGCVKTLADLERPLMRREFGARTFNAFSFRFGD